MFIPVVGFCLLLAYPGDFDQLFLDASVGLGAPAGAIGCLSPSRTLLDGSRRCLAAPLLPIGRDAPPHPIGRVAPQ